MAAVLSAGAVAIRRWELPNVGISPNAHAAANAAAAPTVRDLAALEAQAHDEGYAAGRAEGLAAAQQQVREHLGQLDALFAAAARPIRDLDAQTEQQLAELATIVARRVIASELQLAPALILRAVQQAAAALPAAARELRVHVHPDDLALLQDAPTTDSHWQCVADPTLARGDCQLESTRSRLDARVETRLAAVIDAVLGDAADGRADP
jgi:flagellar assembly protein FliH